RDWLYVDDHCKALDKVLHAPIDKIKGEVINLGTARSISVLDIAQKIKQMMNSSSPIVFVGDRPGQVFRHTSSTRKALELLDWKAETSFEDGLARTIRWYQENERWWNKSLWLRQVPIRTAAGKVEMH
ncbi:MAG: GDP-mannose 4,6-dehydratase, partial [Armatimonadetes bacterium]|nr:GDP-mannose 4,6-dehydratase [Armatimonadota bacterium]